MTSERLREDALKCVRSGLSIVPIDHKTKRPLFQLLLRDSKGKPHWEPYQHCIVDETTVSAWCTSGMQSFAVVCGEVSGGLLVLDFDVERFYFAWKEAVGELARDLPVQRTGSGNRYQVFLRCKQPGGNDKLAWAADEQEKSGRTIAIETRGEGGYAVVPPSLHPSGNRYEMVAGSLSDIPVISQARADALIAAARKLDESPYTRQERESREQQAREAHKRRRSSYDGHPSVIDAFNATHDIEAILVRHGYTQSPRGRYIRPGGRSESVSIKEGRSCHWSTNDPLNDGKVSSGCGVHDAFDIYCHYDHGGDLKAAIKAVADQPGYGGNGDKSRNGLRSAPAPAGPPAVTIDLFIAFPLDALPEPLRSFIKDTARAMGCDPSYIALPLLAALASAIGNTRRIELKSGWTEPAIIWTAIVGESGTLKSPAQEIALRALRKRQHAAMRDHAEAMANHQTELMLYEKNLRAWKSKPGGDPPEKPDEPYAERYCCSDATIEALAVLLLQNPRGLLLVYDELSGWLGSFDRYAQGRGGDAAKYLEMFGGRPIIIDRKTGQSKTIYVPRASVSITGGIQPRTLCRALGNEHRENGLAARLLLACPPRQPKRWTEDDIPAQMEEPIERVFDKLYSLTLVTQQGEDKPLDLPLTPEGIEAWIAFYNEHAREQSELTGDLAAVWSKLEGYAARFALIVHLVRWAAGDKTLDNPNIVDERSIATGALLSRWFGHEARRVYAIMSEDPDEREQRQLVEKIQANGGSMTARHLRRTSREYRSTEDAKQDLEGLVQAGVGNWELPKPGPLGGRPSRHFVLKHHDDADKTHGLSAGIGVMSTSTASTRTDGSHRGCVGTTEYDARFSRDVANSEAVCQTIDQLKYVDEE